MLLDEHPILTGHQIPSKLKMTNIYNTIYGPATNCISLDILPVIVNTFQMCVCVCVCGTHSFSYNELK